MNRQPPPDRIRTAIIPVSSLTAGGLTGGSNGKQWPLTVVDKPLIQYAIEEALAAGMSELIFVTEPSRQTLHDPFGHSDDLQSELQRRQKFELIELVLDLQAPHLTSVCVRQGTGQGLGDAVLSARNIIRDHTFALIAAEDLLHHRPNVLQQLLLQHSALPSPARTNLLAVERVTPGTSPPHLTVSGHPLGERHPRLRHLTHIASATPAPDQLGCVGRYILTSAIFEHLEATRSGTPHGLTQALATLMQSEPVHAYEYEGLHYDCRSTLGYLRANVEFGLRDPDLRTHFGKYIAEVAATQPLNAPLTT